MRLASKLAAVALLGLATMAIPTPAHAAPVEQVVAACDKMDAANPGSCSYTVDSGGLHGCTANTCFVCPIDGSRQCHAAARNGSKGRVGVANIGSLQLPPETRR